MSGGTLASQVKADGMKVVYDIVAHGRGLVDSTMIRRRCEADVSSRTVDRWVSELASSGLIEQNGRGPQGARRWRAVAGTG